ncbi:DUF916 and DUF3324 domain-containing protein [Lactococcus sp. dk322]|nr:DUF3324 domain-containing protein [Lactococcus sp. dk101]TXK44251.1 DUF916 and DUF3324 domain-containing protein [Lactococcus sp. dk310]TXK49982.1 DUF916 and DUF3324 domain-containing protein [Lactococcus sp. dk322]
MYQMTEGQKLKKKYLFMTLLLTALIFGLGAPKAMAATMDFTINPQIPSNQANPGEGFYDLLMPTPGSQENLQIVFKNVSKKTVTVETAVASATTATSGVVQYTPNNIKADKTLKYDLKSLVQIPSEITLSPDQTKIVTVKVSMPSESFHGIIAGGLTFKEKGNSQSTSSNKGIMITNAYQYMVSVLMRQFHDKQAPQLVLNNVVAGQENARNVISVNLENTAAYFLNNMNVNAQVVGLDNSSLKYSFKNSAMQMAPNSNFNMAIPVSLQGALTANQYSKPLQAGKYRMTMTAYGQEDSAGSYSAPDTTGTTQHYDYRWTFTKDFTITQAQAAALNKTDMSLPKPNYFWIYVMNGLAVVLVAAFVTFFVVSRKRKKAHANEKDQLQAKIDAMQKELEAKNKD